MQLHSGRRRTLACLVVSARHVGGAQIAELVRGGPASVWLWPTAISVGSGRALDGRSERRTSRQERLTFTTACGQPQSEKARRPEEESPLGQELFGHVQNAESNAFGDRLVMRIPH